MTQEHPTIPQIVRALTTLSDRQRDREESIREEYRPVIHRMEDKARDVQGMIDRRDKDIEILKGVIEDLCWRIQRTSDQLARDNQKCVYSEPLELFDLLGREYDPQKLISAARSKRRRLDAREARDQRTVEDAERRAGVLPCPTQFSSGPCAGTAGHAGQCTTIADEIPVAALEGPDDVCECGCKRKDHKNGGSGWGAQCTECPVGEELWRHEFKLKAV